MRRRHLIILRVRSKTKVGNSNCLHSISYLSVANCIPSWYRSKPVTLVVLNRMNVCAHVSDCTASVNVTCACLFTCIRLLRADCGAPRMSCCVFVAVFLPLMCRLRPPTALQPAARDQRDPVTSDLSWAEPQPQAPGCMSQTGCDAWNGG